MGSSRKISGALGSIGYYHKLCIYLLDWTLIGIRVKKYFNKARSRLRTLIMVGHRVKTCLDLTFTLAVADHNITNCPIKRKEGREPHCTNVLPIGVFSMAVVEAH